VLATVVACFFRLLPEDFSFGINNKEKQTRVPAIWMMSYAIGNALEINKQVKYYVSFQALVLSYTIFKMFLRI